MWIRGKNSTGFGTLSTSAIAKPIANMGVVSLTASNGQLTANWTSVAGADQYEVFYSTTNSIPANPSQTVTGTTATISNLTNGTTYYIWVKAKNTNGNSTSASISGKPIGTPGTPTLTAGFRELSVSWASVAGADQYEVYYGIGSATLLAATVTGTSTTITELTGGTTYHVRLRAKNTIGVSDYGSSKSGTPSDTLSPGLYKGSTKIGNQNLSMALSYISSNAVSGDNFIIVLGGNESIAPATLNYTNKTIGITLLGYGSERIITLSSEGSMFTVNAGVTLTLDENMTLVGRSDNYAPSLFSPLVYIAPSGNLIMNNGSKIRDNNSGSTDQNKGGGVFIYGTFTMNGGIIKNNISACIGGGAVFNRGTFVMNDGEISGNTSPSNTGSVHYEIGSFIMYGGIIKGNTGAGICFSTTFTMYGGTISGNSSHGVHGISPTYSATFTMFGGIISGNGGFGLFGYNMSKKPYNEESLNSGIIYGSEVTGLKNNSGAIYVNLRPSGAYANTRGRNLTAWETDCIDTTTERGLSRDGEPPYGQ